MDYDLGDQSADGGFLHFWGIEGWRSVAWKVRISGSFGVRVVLVPAGTIAWGDSSLFFHIRQTPYVAT